jgi:hypothetical protein
MSIRSRLERLERWQPRRVTIWHVLDGERDPSELDPVDMALLQEAADADVERDFIEERIAAVARPLPSTDASGPPPTNQEGSLEGIIHPRPRCGHPTPMSDQITP